MNQTERYLAILAKSSALASFHRATRECMDALGDGSSAAPENDGSPQKNSGTARKIGGRPLEIGGSLRNNDARARETNSSLRNNGNKPRKIPGISRKNDIPLSDGVITASKAIKLIYRTSVCASGPVLTAYVYWVLVNAHKQGVKRLYFLARDGRVMYEIARILNRTLKFSIEFRYLYVSRLALRRAQYCLNPEEALDYICRDGLQISLKVAMARTGLPEAVCCEILTELGYLRGSWDTLLSGTALAELKMRLFRCQNFHSAMSEDSRCQLSLLCRYLAQEGIGDGKSFAFVDSGWTGSIQRSLAQILQYSFDGLSGISGFYFGIQSRPTADTGEYYCFYFSWKREERERFIHFNNNLFECWCMAEHGMTVGYLEENGQVFPVQKPYVPLWHEKEQADFIRQYACRLAAFWEEERPDADVLGNAVAPLLRMAMQRPEREEALVYGSIPFCDDSTEAYLNPLAFPLSGWDIFYNLTAVRIFTKCFLHSGKRFFRESCWKEGSCTLLPQPFSVLMLLDCRLTYAVKKLRRQE